MSVPRAEERDSVVPGGGGGDGGEVGVVEGDDGLGDDGQLAAQGGVHVKAAEVLPDLGQLRVDALKRRGDEVLQISP